MMPIEGQPSTHLVIHTDPGCDDALNFAAVSAASGRFRKSISCIYGNDATRQTGKIY